jgi:pyridoxal phosphate enzyme (YggS family)
MTKQNEIYTRYQRVLERIDQAASKVGRDPTTIQVVVVTKGHPLESVKGALDAGLKVFGENYPEEGISKISALPKLTDLKWHMIGHVQSRKAKLVSAHYDWLHSLDSIKLARRLDRFSGEVGRKLPVLLEFNVSGEKSKYGWEAWDEKSWSQLVEEISPILEYPNLEVCGLMTMAPFLAEPEQTRPYFQRLHQLKDYFSKHLPGVSWQELSMGMSSDYEIAVQEGATMVRIGTAIMGERP